MAYSGRLLAVALALVMGLPEGARAQRREPLLIDPGAAHARRDARRIENQLLMDPDSAAVELGRARRDLYSRSRGVYLNNQEADVERRLDQAGRELTRQRQEPPAPATGARTGERDGALPSTYGEDAPLPSMRRELGTIGGLMDRAQTALAAGRQAQAASDLATARGLLNGLEPGDGLPADTLAGLRSRLDTLTADGDS
jgi:hypothetical protein